MTELTDQDKARLTLTVHEMITIQAALRMALEDGKITPTVGESAMAKLDKAIDRWAS